VARARLIVPITGVGYAGLASAVVAELPRLTDRDRLLLDLLADHATLTTDQITDLAFGSAGRARIRLNILHERGVLDRFRHYQRAGSQSWRWTLGPLGAAIVATRRGEPIPRPALVRDRTARLANSPTLGHRIGVNGFFVALAAHARHAPGVRLARWWNEARATEAAGDIVRPDGHGLWVDNGRAVPFWLEYDTGTERPLSRVADKLPGYARLSGTRWSLPVLLWLPTAVREANLHAHLRRTGVPAGVTVATASADHAAGHGGPTGPVWQRPGHPERVTLAQLPAPHGRPAPGDPTPWDG